MADISASNWSPTDANNNTAAPDGAPEGMNPSGVNDTMRAMMGAMKRWFGWTIPATTGGTSTAYTLTYTVAPGALVDGMSHLVQFNATNGSAPTLNVNSLGAKAIHKYSGGAWGAVAPGDILANSAHRVSYNAGDDTYRITSSSSPIGAVFLGIVAAFTAAINEAKGADIASATTTDIGAATGNYVVVTGTTTITGFGTVQAGTRRVVEFSGALTLTHNATSLILPGGANITTAAGDVYTFVSEGSGNWRCVGATPVCAVPVTATYTTNADLSTTIPDDDTIPQVTEGTQIFSQSFTAKNVAHRIRVRFSGFVSTASGADRICAALFVDGASNAVAASWVTTSNNNLPATMYLEYEAAQTSGAHTYSIRVGADAFTVRMNGTSLARIGGGVAATRLTIEEVLAP